MNTEIAEAWVRAAFDVSIKNASSLNWLDKIAALSSSKSAAKAVRDAKAEQDAVIAASVAYHVINDDATALSVIRICREVLGCNN